ncbi:polysaccharide biosynthesis C-terminal domain-containing protein [Pollutibacter soli]|uniref:polysaccharide biosynthesis C-terminal domain-containing protein n=1 Tax=Pollutibacter soli TaxID=3034157 RepID=UPI0030141C55
MGEVRRQSILSSIFIYIGFAIGAINILVLFPKYFSAEQIGLTRIILDVALLFATACTLGSIPITIKFYPFYNTFLEKKDNDLPFYTILLCLTGVLLMFIILPFFESTIIKKFGARSPLFVDYFYLVYPFTACLTFFYLFEAYSWSLKKTVLSNALKEFAFRIITTALIVLFISGIINFPSFINLYSYIFGIPVLIFIFSFTKSNNLPIQPKPSHVTRRLLGKMLPFAGFIFGGSMLNIIARTNDTIIIASQSAGGLADAAVFTIATYLVTVMEVPQRSLVSITTPVIAEAWRSKDLIKIDRLYKKTSLNLLIIGLGIFGLVLLNVDDATKFLGPEYILLGSIVLVSGIAKLIDLATGLNTQILLLSKFWRLEFFTNMLLVGLSIPLNYWLTKKFNVLGPAYGNLIALSVFNAIRLGLIYKKFGMQPFSKSNLLALMIGTVSFAIVFVIPVTENIFINVAIRSIIFCGLYGLLILKFKVSSDIHGLVEIIRSKFKW